MNYLIRIYSFGTLYLLKFYLYLESQRRQTNIGEIHESAPSLPRRIHRTKFRPPSKTDFPNKDPVCLTLEYRRIF